MTELASFQLGYVIEDKSKKLEILKQTQQTEVSSLELSMTGTTSLRETTSLRIFKSELKSWIRNNIDIT